MLQDCHIGSVFLNSSDSTAVHIICLWSIPHHLLVPRPPTRRPIPFPPIHSSSLSFEPRCHDSSSLSQSANTATILPKHLHQQILYQWTPLNPHVPFFALARPSPPLLIPRRWCAPVRHGHCPLIPLSVKWAHVIKHSPLSLCATCQLSVLLNPTSVSPTGGPRCQTSPCWSIL